MAYEQTEALRGLSREQVEQSRRRDGGNTLPAKKRSSFWRELLGNFGDPIIKTLLCALLLNLLFLFRNHNWFETLGIAVAVFLATFVSTLSEYGSESAFLKLQAEAAKTKCRVKRAEGVRELPVADVVCGDLVLLQAGERIPADGVLLSGGVRVDQSALNGESKEARKEPAQSATLGGKWELESKTQLFRGSVVTEGEGVMLVQRVGARTYFGSMAQELQDVPRESPLKLRLGKLAGTISKFGFLAAALVAGADLFNNIVLDNAFIPSAMLAELASPQLMVANLLRAAMLAITVIVVAVPEGLPMMITVVLSSNMFRMLKDNVMLRKLVGIETSGSLNLLFTDKTGTLTRGKLQVSHLIGGDGRKRTARELHGCFGLCQLAALSGTLNTSSTVSQNRALGGNATDRALLEFVLPFRQMAYQCQRTGYLPFDSKNKFSAATIAGIYNLTLVKGAPEKLLPLCTHYYDENAQTRPIASPQRLQALLAEEAKEAGRVICLCTSAAPVEDGGTAASALPSGNLTLIGLAVIRDQVRPEAKRAVRQINRAGVQVVMITGDNKDTAVAVAREAGLLEEQTRNAVLTSAELATMSDADVARALPSLRVVARALPSDKTRLVRIAQGEGLVTGMTGDGINDAPALKHADVGFAMGSGTEVAREAADIVILDDNIASIAKAILYGRTIFKSIQKFIIFQLTMNLCAVGVSLIGPFIGVDVPITVVQMLWINIIMDTLAGLAFAGEPPLDEYMEEPPKRRDAAILTPDMWSQILRTGLYTVLLCLTFLKLPAIHNLFRYADGDLYVLTAFFALFVFTGVFNSFNARTPRLNLFANLGRNRAFIGVMLCVSLIQVALVYWGGLLFRTAGLTARELGITLLLAATVIPVDLLRKALGRDKRDSAPRRRKSLPVPSISYCRANKPAEETADTPARQPRTRRRAKRPLRGKHLR